MQLYCMALLVLFAADFLYTIMEEHIKETTGYKYTTTYAVSIYYHQANIKAAIDKKRADLTRKFFQVPEWKGPKYNN